jgi:quercetin dioxygenase-like cupin family protein
VGNKEIIRTAEVLVREMELFAGDVTEWHYHTQVHDYFVCLEGRIQVETKIPGGVFLLEPGQRFLVTSGLVHRVVNLAGGTSKYLLVQGVGSYDFCKE